jgi:SAM-dependent methyltransferase
MVRVARQRSESYPNIEYLVADVMRWAFPRDRFDCIASIATLHHLPMQQVLQMMKEALRPCGRLIILDIYRPQTVSDRMLSLMAAPVNLSLRLAKSRRLREPREIREAWAEHGRFDVYPTIREVRRVCSAVLPGARARRHLLWRYSIVWEKPGSRCSDDGRYHR